MKSAKAILIVLALALLSSGCSRVTFGYNHGAWLLRYWINGYTSFNPGQKEEIRHDVADYMRWHRQYALPEYIAFLQNLNALADRDDALSANDVVRVRSELARLYKLTMTPLVRPAAHLLRTLDRRQIEELRNTLAEKNRDLREETLSGTEIENLVSRAEKYIHFVEGLAGHLTHDQEEKVKEMSLRIPFITASYIERREARQRTLISLLNEHASEDRIAAFLFQWVDMQEGPISPQEQQVIEAYDRAMSEMIVRIFAMLTTPQKNHLRKKIADYIDDFQRLHSVTETAGTARDAQGTTSGN